jgi:ABC-type glycerol-3-phosphate transport system substrate-binding protein
MEADQLIKTGSDVLVLEELEGWIRSGRLRVGQRLPSVKSLQKLLGVGQASVESAKQQLERRGLIETRQRSGSYLLADAKDKIAAEEKTLLGSAQMLDFYLPRAESKTVSIYTMDCLGRSRNAWEAVIDEFQTTHRCQVELLTPEDGHLMDLIKKRSIDVVHTTQEMIDAIGNKEFYDLSPHIPSGEFESDLLPLVLLKWNQQEAKISLPFAVTIKYIFVNRSIQKRYKMKDEQMQNPFEFLEAMKAAHRQASPYGLHAFAFSRLEHLLTMVGAMSPKENGGVFWDRELAECCLQSLHASGLPIFHDHEIPNIFASGHALYAKHWSFTCSELLERVDFEWEATPLPLAGGQKSSGFLSVLAVPRSSDGNEEAFTFAAHLVSKSSQEHFAKVGGNLPVRSSAIPALADTEWQHLSLETLNKALATSDTEWPHREWNQFEYSIPREFQMDLLSGRRQVAEILAPLEKIVRSKASLSSN